MASIYSVGLSEMSQLEEEFSRRYPQARLEVEYLRPEKVYEAVVADRADLGLMSYPEPSKEVTVLPWRRGRNGGGGIAVSSAGEEAGSAAGGSGRARFHRRSTKICRSARDIDRFLREHHVHVNVTLHFDNLQMIKEAVAHGEGVSIMPARIMEEEIRQGRLVPIPIASWSCIGRLGSCIGRRSAFTGPGKRFWICCGNRQERGRRCCRSGKLAVRSPC